MLETPQKPPARIFLSYARVDEAWVAGLAEALQRAGHELWWDRHLRGGEAFAAEIEHALAQAGAVVVVWSDAGAASRWVLDEAGVAAERGILVPIALGGARPPLGFRQMQAIDFGRGPAGRDPAFPALLDAIGAKLGEAPRAPPPMPRRTEARRTEARRWWPWAVAAIAIAAPATVAVVALTTAPQPTDAPPAVVAAPTATPSAATKSVAVLPFRALSAGADDGYFADGVTEEVMNALGTVPGLLVTARTSAFAFKGQDKPVPEIARALGVAHVVEGSVRRAGDQLRVTARLVRAADGFQLWQSSYDRAAGGAFDVQTEIAGNVAEALGVALDEGARRQMAIRRIDNVEAFIAFQKGYELYERAHADLPLYPTLIRANAQFDRALALAPATADAYLMRADLAQHLLWDISAGRPVPPELSPVDFADQRRRLSDDLDQAVRHSRTPAQRAQMEYARALFSDDWSGLRPKINAVLAIRECVQPVPLDDIVPFTPAADVERHFERQRPCDPLAFDSARGVLVARLWMGDAEGALRAAADMAARGEASRTRSRAEVQGNLMLGRFEAARKAIESASNSDGFDVRLNLLRVHRASGDDAAAARLEASLLREAAGDLRSGLAMAAWAGDRERAAEIAARLDATPVGDKTLLWVTMTCLCGAPFPIEATPNFRARLDAAGFSWPPPTHIRFPQKDW